MFKKLQIYKNLNFQWKIFMWLKLLNMNSAHFNEI